MNDKTMGLMVGLLDMVLESDKFHLEVAKALLSDEPISEQRRVALRDSLAKRESRHEQVERLVEQMKKELLK